MQSAPKPQTTQMEMEPTSLADDLLLFFRTLVEIGYSSLSHGAMAKKIQQYYLNFLNNIKQNISSHFEHNKKMLLENLTLLLEQCDALKEIPRNSMDNLKKDIQANGASLLSSLSQDDELNNLIDSLVDLRNTPSSTLQSQQVVSTRSNYPFYNHLVYIHVSPQASVEKMLGDGRYWYNQRNYVGAISCFESAKEIVEESKREDFDNYNYYVEKIHFELTDAYCQLGYLAASLMANETPDCLLKTISLAEENGRIEKSEYSNIWLSAHIKLGEFFYSIGIHFKESMPSQALELMEESLTHLSIIITRYPNLKNEMVLAFNPTIKAAIACASTVYNKNKDLKLRIDLSHKLLVLYELDTATNHARNRHSNHQYIVLNTLMALGSNHLMPMVDKIKAIELTIEKHLNLGLHQFNNELDAGYQYQFLILLLSLTTTVHQSLRWDAAAKLVDTIDNFFKQVPILQQMYDVKQKHAVLLKSMAFHINNLIYEGIYKVNNAEQASAFVFLYQFLQEIPLRFEAQFLNPKEKLTFQIYEHMTLALRLKAHFLFEKPVSKQIMRETLTKLQNIFVLEPADTENLTDFYQWRANIAADIYAYSVKVAGNPIDYSISVAFLDLAINLLFEIPEDKKTQSMWNILKVCELQQDLLNAEILINTPLPDVNVKKLVESLEEISDRIEEEAVLHTPLIQWFVTAINLKFDLIAEYIAKICDQQIHELRNQLLSRPFFFSTDARQRGVNDRLLSFYHEIAVPLLHDKSEKRLQSALSTLEYHVTDKGFRHVKVLKNIKASISNLILLGYKTNKNKPASRARSNSI
jgi:hypothetical protein